VKVFDEKGRFLIRLASILWSEITGKPTSPSLEEMAVEHEADGTHGAITPTGCTLKPGDGDLLPKDHAATHEPGGGDAMAVDEVVGTGSLRTLGGGAQQAMPGDATPAPGAHKDSHDPEDGADKLDTAAGSTIQPDDAAAIGTSHSLARADHKHAIVAATPVKVAAANAEGISTSFARADHVHEREHAIYTDADAVAAVKADANFPLATITFIIDGGGSAITTGQKGHLEIPFACTITGWTILADVSGSIVVDVWKDTYANFPPTVADTIAGTEKPTLSAVQKNQDLSLTTWTTAVAAGDILAFNVDSVATVTRVTVSLKIAKS